MKQRHKACYRDAARLSLRCMSISVGQDFHTLSSTQVDALIAEATRTRYQQPKNANGSRARYFHDRLQRHAQMKVEGE